MIENKEEFKSLVKEAGFKNKYELAKALNLAHGTVNQWNGTDKPYPPYLKPFLKLCVENKKLKEKLN